MEILQWLTDGGPLMYILFAMSILALAIIIDKFHQFIKSGIYKPSRTDQVVGAIKADNAEEALRVVTIHESPIAKILKSAVSCCYEFDMTEREIEAEVTRVGQSEVRELEKRLAMLSSIGTLSPLVGLLGTVMGMIKAFAVLEGAGTQVSPALLAGGIWQALITTAYGLLISIFALAAFHYFEEKVNTLMAETKDAVVRILLYTGRLSGAELMATETVETEE